MPLLIIAIDGGAASGKSSTARALCKKFPFLHVDTGSHYRALTAALLACKVDYTNLPQLKTALSQLRLGTVIEKNNAQITIDNRPIPDAEIRTDAVNAAVSHFAAIPELRQTLLAYQRSQADLARAQNYPGLIMEGRDIGSVIFPNADLRFFLQADPAARAARRAKEGQNDSIAERDKRDSTRKTAPLICPAGAISIDSTHLTLDQVVEKIAAHIKAKLEGRIQN